MNARDVIKTALTSTQNLLNWYLSDLSDADLHVRPVPTDNNIAYQLGHLISSEVLLLHDQLPGAVYPELPAHYREHYSGKAAGITPPGGYLKKAEYVDWFNKVRGATIANAEPLTDADLDRQNTNVVAQFAPTLGALLILIANHTLMHAGQFTVVRRALNKPVLF
jgi:hypothetical protein